VAKNRTQTVPETDEQKAERELESKRRTYTRALNNGLSYEEAVQTAKRIIVETAIRGCQPEYGDGLSCEYKRGWGINATLYVRFNRVWEKRVTNPDNNRQSIEFWEARVEVSWSSTGRDVADAVAAIKLYTEVTELAAELQSVLTERPITSYFDLDAKESKLDNTDQS
jgi:hypothetical protein